MLALLAAAIIAGGPAPAPPACCLRQPAITSSPSNVETSHRIGHVISTTVLTTSVYGGARYFGANRKTASIIAAGAALTAVLAKELYDYHSAARSFSMQDVALGTAGTAAGLLLAYTIHWPEDGNKPK